jgi:hypothetical protein
LREPDLAACLAATAAARFELMDGVENSKVAATMAAVAGLGVIICFPEG